MAERIPQWKADELFHRMIQPLIPSAAEIEVSKSIEPKRTVWLAAQGPADEAEADQVFGRAVLLFWASVLFLPALYAVFSTPIATGLTLFLAPPVFVACVGRYARPLSGYNVVFWALYAGGLATLLLVV